MSSNEISVRQELAAIFRLLAHYRMTDLIHTHASARQSDHTLLINRYDLMFEEITASSLVEIDESGALMPGYEDAEVNNAGCNIHSAIHEAFPEIGFVVHTHTRAGAAVSAQANGLLPISQQALMFGGAIGYHDFEGFVLSKEERVSLARDLAGNKALILRNHGLIVVGANAYETYNRLWNLERACEIQIAAMSGGAELVLPAKEVQELMGQQAQSERQLQIEKMAWNASLRLIEGQGADYRT
ncbi:class II aldolase/adducin family protein [Sphingobium sp. AR-3-1]|uniref:Class II aldolase/adducin family protein n=1 Tax=Sphingobium psychrophilum TaxID=2728834 RepID=A0A7X9WXI0_9SPHN|nr:class II aldolase/adducin family protein [Sphingobium psychrophilum]NML11730.1 class II aldolase/adducin family protein [Sphingobium psychrophilum]